MKDEEVIVDFRQDAFIKRKKKENNMVIENTDKVNDRHLLIFYVIKTHIS